MPTLDGGQGNQFLKFWFPLIFSDPTLFIASIFSTLSHRRSRWLLKGQASDIFLPEDQHLLSLCYSHAIRMLNASVQDSAKNTTDAFLIAVLFMSELETLGADQSSWDWSKKSPFQAPLQSLQWLDVHGVLLPNPVHVAGLISLLERRGGIENLTFPGLTGMITMYADGPISLSPSLSELLPTRSWG
jgi:hypothetical protein